LRRVSSLFSAQANYLPSDDERTLLRREADIARMASPILLQVHRYWLAKRGARALPAWSDIDPAEIARLLPNLLVVAIEHDPLRVYFRLVGTAIAEFRGDVTGHYVDSVPWNMPATRASVQESYARVVASRAPLFVEIDVRTVTGAPRRVCAGIWPLAPSDDAPIDRCLAAEDFGDFIAADLPWSPAR
jgi:hypothetical protein